MERTLHRTRLSMLAAFAAALIVALGLSCAAHAQAYAQEGVALTMASVDTQASGGDMATVALTVVDESDNDHVLYNGKVIGLTTENTVADLLAAVGYTQVETYAGDTSTYVATYNSPYFLGKEYDTETGQFWMTVFDGSGNYPDTDAAMLGSKLQDGKHYQYVYRASIYPEPDTFAYSATIPDPLTTAVPKSLQLMSNLADRFGKGGADAAITKTTYNAALALAVLGRADLIDVDALMKNADAAVAAKESAGALAKYAIALEAAGVDATTYVQAMDQAMTKDETVYSAPLILSAYRVTRMTPSQTAALGVDSLMKAILDHQAESGLFPDTFSSAQTTAQVMNALAHYKDDATYGSQVAPALEKARAAAAAQINADGTITPDTTWNQASMDYNAMGELANALVVYDGATGSEASKLVAALAGGADATLDGFAADGNLADETYAAADAFLGLAAAYSADPNRVHLDNVVDVRVNIDDLTAVDITKTYTGKAINPVPALTYNGKKLVKDTDFTVSYTNKNKKAVKAADVKAAGTYYVKIDGMKAYTGTKYVELTVNKANISSAKATVKSKKYTGKKYNPTPTVKFNKAKLKKGTDFKLSYTDKNKKAIKASKVKKAGTYYVKLTGKGNFTGTKYVKFKITKK